MKSIFLKYLKTKRSRWTAVLVALLFAASSFYYWQNETIDVETFVYENAKIPKAFDGFTIVQISDLHDKKLGRDNRRLFQKIRAAKPDMIAVTGDLTNNPTLDVDFASAFVAEAAKIAPVYYVSGNHECFADPPTQYETLLSALETRGAKVLSVEKIEVKRGDDAIVLAGFDDPFYFCRFRWKPYRKIIAEKLGELAFDRGDKRLTILLAHRPDPLDLYADAGVDLVFVGHAHGGQIRMPFIGGLYAPEQGFFPRYTSGVYRLGGTTEIISRGLGPSVFPTRIFNRPHLVVCKLRSVR